MISKNLCCGRMAARWFVNHVVVNIVTHDFPKSGKDHYAPQQQNPSTMHAIYCT